MTTIRGATKALLAYAEIRERIIDGTLEPGSVVSQEELAESLGVSTTPLREALNRLERDRLVQMEAHRDLVITALTKRELRDIYAVRLALDPLAASLAATKATDRQISQMTAIHERMHHGGPVDPAVRVPENREFHRSIYTTSGNDVLTDLLDTLWDRADRYHFVLGHRASDMSAADATAETEHHQILAALQARDSDQAEALTRTHVMTGYDAIVALGDDLTPIDTA